MANTGSDARDSAPSSDENSASTTSSASSTPPIQIDSEIIRAQANVLTGINTPFFTGHMFHSVRAEAFDGTRVTFGDDLVYLRIDEATLPPNTPLTMGPQQRCRDGVVWTRASALNDESIWVRSDDGESVRVEVATLARLAPDQLLTLLHCVWKSVSVPLCEQPNRSKWREKREPRLQMQVQWRPSASGFSVAYDRIATNVFDAAVKRLEATNARAFRDAILRRTRSAVAKWAKTRNISIPRSECETPYEELRRDLKERARLRRLGAPKKPRV